MSLNGNREHMFKERIISDYLLTPREIHMVQHCTAKEVHLLCLIATTQLKAAGPLTADGV